VINLSVFSIVHKSESDNVHDPFPGYNLGIGCNVMYLESVLSILFRYTCKCTRWFIGRLCCSSACFSRAAIDVGMLRNVHSSVNLNRIMYLTPFPALICLLGTKVMYVWFVLFILSRAGSNSDEP
jgi:uncharacterized membrane protein